MEIKGKIVIVTGASRGIGEATARLLAQKGAKVVLAARSVSELKALAKELPGSFAVKMDLSKPDQVKAMARAVWKKYGRIDLLINNAAQFMWGPMEEAKLKDFKKITDVNLFGPFLAMQAVIPYMKKQGGGMILNICSTGSSMHIRNQASYLATKAALSTLSLTARRELVKDNIIVSVFYARLTKTKIYQFSAAGKNIRFWEKEPGKIYEGLKYDLPEEVAVRIAELADSEKAEMEMY